MTDPVTQTATTPNADDQAPGIIIPDEVKTTFPDLVPQIIASPSMDENEKNYWFSVLPIMNTEQVAELRDILASEQKRLAQEAEEGDPQAEAEIDLVEAERRRQERRQQMLLEEKKLLSEDSAQADSLLAEL